MTHPQVVRVYSTYQDPASECPWQRVAPRGSTGTGVLIAPQRILHGAPPVPEVGVLATRGDTLAELHPNCHAGTYIDYRAVSGAATCEDCPVGKALPRDLGAAASDCADCIAGRYASAAGSTVCPR